MTIAAVLALGSYLDHKTIPTTDTPIVLSFMARLLPVALAHAEGPMPVVCAAACENTGGDCKDTEGAVSFLINDPDGECVNLGQLEWCAFFCYPSE